MKTCPKCRNKIEKKTLFLRNNSYKLVCTHCNTTLHVTKKSFLIYFLVYVLICFLIFMNSIETANKFVMFGVWGLISNFIIQPIAFFYEET